MYNCKQRLTVYMSDFGLNDLDKLVDIFEDEEGLRISRSQYLEKIVRDIFKIKSKQVQ